MSPLGLARSVRGERSAVRPAPRWVRRLAGDRAEERVFRALAFGFLPAGLLFGVLATPAAIGQASHFPAWWLLLAFVLGTAPAVLLGALAFTVPLAALRWIARTAAVCTVGVQASVPFVVHPWDAANGQVWFLQVIGLGLIASALAMRPGFAVLTQLIGALVVAATRAATDHSDALLQGVQDGLYLLLFTLSFLALGLGALGAGRIADEAEAASAHAAGETAADAARDRERARVNALVHDRVLATLLAAARPVPGSSELLQADARRALAGLRALLADEQPHDAQDAQALLWQVQAVTTELAPEAGFGYDAARPLTVPADAAEALLQATEEALRNTLRHAGAANRTVHARWGDDGFSIDVLDDGIGFDRAAVPAGRLGISESIEGRLRALPGGSAAVVSEPGVGTRVLLRWSGGTVAP